MTDTAKALTIRAQPCPVCDGIGGDHQIGCQVGEAQR